MRKVALVTGCAKGIGREIILELARHGYDVIGTYNTSIEEIETLKKQIDIIGVKYYFYKLDLLNDNEINTFCDNINNSFSHIDLLINNAALSLDNEFESKTSDEFIDVLKVNVVGPFLLCQKLYKIIYNGVIINIGSTDGINTYTKYNIDYSASKAGLINLTKSLGLILSNIKVYCICPNWVNTESIRQMNQDYLREEMIRIGQRKLIEPTQISKRIIDLIDSNIESGSLIIMEDNNDR